MKRIITALFGAACLTVVEAQTFQPAMLRRIEHRSATPPIVKRITVPR